VPVPVLGNTQFWLGEIPPAIDHTRVLAIDDTLKVVHVYQ
jgi:hypothetical protein